MNLIWCPNNNEKLLLQMQTFIRAFPETHPTPLHGGKKELGGFNPAACTLYILAHGHGQMPVFKCGDDRWTATQLVALLQSDLLPKDWRKIELLVCHAGESVNSRKIGNELLRLRARADIPIIGRFLKNSAQKKFEKTAKKGQKPSPFTSKNQLLPLAAQFAYALKVAGYTDFSVTSYGAPVAQRFSLGYVSLDMSTKDGGWTEKLEDHQDLIKIWR
jgi:hypothetical protein